MRTARKNAVDRPGRTLQGLRPTDAFRSFRPTNHLLKVGLGMALRSCRIVARDVILFKGSRDATRVESTHKVSRSTHPANGATSEIKVFPASSSRSDLQDSRPSSETIGVYRSLRWASMGSSLATLRLLIWVQPRSRLYSCLQGSKQSMETISVWVTFKSRRFVQMASRSKQSGERRRQ